ncbi:acetate--CoA ligase family protein [bacterium]|nr:acetate--CoA ligase family protein [bacterium]
MSSLDKVFKPRSIAIIGASRKKQTIGREIIHNLIEYEFTGAIYPVNPNADSIHSVKCYSSVKEIPGEIDLAIITVPKQLVLGVVDECGEKGIKGLIVITAGFKEVGAEGAELEQKLVEKIKQYGMRMVGPNCMGIINNDEQIQMNATFAPTRLSKGQIAFISQSGALGVAILENAAALQLGISCFASIGNKPNISGNDLLEYWKNESNTKLILMYLESFGNPKKFIEIARGITRFKPIIAVKSGRTVAGARAASSHTGALAGADIIVDEMFRQAGVIRVPSIEQLFDLAMAFDKQPLPHGDRVAILSNAGGPAIMATDALISNGLTLAELGQKTKDDLRQILSPDASVTNPIDTTAGGNAVIYGKALQILLADPNVDSMMAIFVPPMTEFAREVALQIVKINEQYPEKTILCCFMSQDKENISYLRTHNIPTYIFPESAVAALAAMNEHRKWRLKHEGTFKNFDVKKDQVKKIIKHAYKENRLYLGQSEVFEILDAYGFRVAANTIVKNEDEAAEFAKKLQKPVVLKVHSSTIVHKSDVGGVQVDLRSESEVRHGYQTIYKNLKEKKLDGQIEGMVVQEMVKGGKEVVLGMNHDKQFGPVIMAGLGGIYVEVLKDVAFRIAPLTDFDAKEMIESLRSYPLLQGVRGEKPVHIATVIEYILRLSQLVIDMEDIAEIDMNPFMVFESKNDCKIVDARIKLMDRP